MYSNSKTVFLKLCAKKSCHGRREMQADLKEGEGCNSPSPQTRKTKTDIKISQIYVKKVHVMKLIFLINILANITDSKMVVVAYKKIVIMATKLGYSVLGQLYVRVINRICYTNSNLTILKVKLKEGWHWERPRP